MADVATAPPDGAWDRFWYSRGNTLTLGIFRFLFGLAVLVEIGTTRARSRFAIEGGFHYPYFPFLKPVPESVYDAIHNLEYPFAAFLALGILPRMSAGVLFGLQGYIFFTDRLNFRNHPYFFLLILLLLVFSPAGKSFSIPAFVRRIRNRASSETTPDPVVAPLTIQRMIQVQVSIVYFYAALHKMTPYYLSGSVLARMLERTLLHGPFAGVVGLPQFWVVSAWITLVLELILSLALWIPRVRPAAMILGIGFHLAIAVTMDIWAFSAAMIASYLLFLDPDTLPRVWERIKARFEAVRGTPRPAAPLPAAQRATGPSRAKKAGSRSARKR